MRCPRQLLLLLVQDAELLPDPAALGDDLVLHQREAHGQDGHAEQHVHRPQQQLGLSLRVLEVGAWHDISEADGGEGDEAEVGGLQPVPPLPQPEQHGPAEDVAADDDHGDGQRHRDVLLVQVVVVVVVVAVVVQDDGLVLGGLAVQGFDVQRDDLDGAAWRRQGSLGGGGGQGPGGGGGVGVAGGGGVGRGLGGQAVEV